MAVSLHNTNQIFHLYKTSQNIHNFFSNESTQMVSIVLNKTSLSSQFTIYFQNAKSVIN